MTAPARPALRGRDRELLALDAVLDGLWGGGSAALVVTGEPGIGKTRILEELAARAIARGGLVLTGRCAEYEADLPFAPWVEALDEHALAVALAVADGLQQGPDGVALATVLPAMKSAGGPPDGWEGEERHRLHSAVRRLLTGFAADRPLVLVLDDMHWADAASVDLVAALLRRPASARVLLALAMRPQQAPERLEAAIDRAAREGRTERLALAPLDVAAAAALLGDDVPSGTRDLLYLESGGNPFYLEHLARSVHAGTGDGVGDHGSAANLPGVPKAVAVALGDELRSLEPTARLVLDAAAIAGVTFEPALVAVVAAASETDALHALDGLVSVGLVRPTQTPRRFIMRHPLVRRAIYDSTGAGWRLAAHGRAADELRRRGETAEALAHHVSQSAAPGDEDAIDVLVAAGTKAQVMAPATAAHWLRCALELVSPSDVARRGGLLVSLASAEASAGHAEAALAAVETAHAELRPEDVEQRVELTVRAAGLDRLIGNHDRAHQRLQKALHDLPDTAMTRQLELFVALAIDALHRRDLDAMLAWGQRAAVAGEAHGDRARHAAGHAMAAMAHAYAGRISDAQSAADAARELVDSLRDDELADCVAAAQFLALAEMYLERFADGEAHALRAVTVARATGQGHMLSVLVIPAAVCGGMLGRLVHARRLLDDAVEAARLADSRFALAYVMMHAASLAIATGDLNRGRQLATEVIELFDGMDESMLTGGATTQLAIAEFEDGRFQAAVTALIEGGGGPDMPLVGGFWRVFLLERLALAQLACGRPKQAATAADVATACADAMRLPLTSAVALRARAAVELDAGDAAAAATLALRAADEALATGAVIEAARARTIAGQALAAAGRRDDAVAALRTAITALDEGGASREAQLATAALRRLGAVRKHSARGVKDAGGLEALTKRERDIAELVWDRRTNREIGQTLFLSTKTVESHMRNIFVKVRVASRVELAREMERAKAAA
jgi:DNA-binding CsgD family transcriptional regulator